MDSLDSLFDDYLISKSRILREIDEETAYIYYLAEAYQLPEFDLELRKPYHSPIRTTNTDDKPSFSVFENTRQKSQLTNYGYSTKYIWKDSGKSNRNVGDIFLLVGALYDLDTEDAILQKMDADFGTGLFADNPFTSVHPVIKVLGKIIPKAPSYIRIKSKPFSFDAILYWRSFGISLELLAKHHVTQVDYFWTSKEQVNPYTPKSLCFAYKIVTEDGGVYYKLYTPNVTEFKFINDYPDYIVEGLDQLTYQSDLLIITKSHKDILVLSSLGYEAVSPKSETTMIPPEKMNYLLSKYKRVLILFDNDGKHNGQKYRELYDLPLIFVPISSGTKDISDYRKKYLGPATTELLKQLTK